MVAVPGGPYERRHGRHRATAELLDRHARGDQPRIQAVRGRRRVSRREVLEGTVSRRRARARVRRSHGAFSRRHGAERARPPGSLAAIRRAATSSLSAASAGSRRRRTREFAGGACRRSITGIEPRASARSSRTSCGSATSTARARSRPASCRDSVRGARPTWPATSRSGARTSRSARPPIHPRRRLERAGVSLRRRRRAGPVAAAADLRRAAS